MASKFKHLQNKRKRDAYEEEELDDNEIGSSGRGRGSGTKKTSTRKGKKGGNSASSSSSSAVAVVAAGKGRVRYRNKQRTLIFSSRGTNAQFRHLMLDMCSLLPHHKKEAKLDVRRDMRAINEICEIKSCNNCMFFEIRKRRDLFLWISKAPSGPSAKFHIQNVHTMDELKLTGNCLKGSRPLLSFDRAFEDPARPHLGLLREVLVQVFGVPRGHPKSKPFVDHVFSFSVLDGRIWFRNYQIVEDTLDEKRTAKEVKRGGVTTRLVEIGPRFVLNLARIFAGSFGGQTLYANPSYSTPNAMRRAEKAVKGQRYAIRKAAKQKSRKRREEAQVEEDELSDVFRTKKVT